MSKSQQLTPNETNELIWHLGIRFEEYFSTGFDDIVITYDDVRFYTTNFHCDNELIIEGEGDEAVQAAISKMITSKKVFNFMEMIGESRV